MDATKDNHRVVPAILVVCLSGLLGCQERTGSAEHPPPAVNPKDGSGPPPKAGEEGASVYEGQPVSYWRRKLGEPCAVGYFDPHLPLAKNRDPEAIPVLLALLADENDLIRANAATCLGMLGDRGKPAAPALVAALSDPKIAGAAAHALGEIGPAAKEARPALITMLGERKFIRRFLAAQALWKITGEPALVLGPLRGLLRSDAKTTDDEAPWIVDSYRSDAAELLGLLGPAARDAVPDLDRYLCERMDRKEWHMSMEAARALGRIGPAALGAVPTLQAALTAPDMAPRVAAAAALWRVTGRDGDRLVKLIRQELRQVSKDFPREQDHAIDALGEFGPQAQAAIPDLLDVLAGPAHDSNLPGDINLHGHARAALKKIEPTGRSTSPAGNGPKRQKHR